MPNPADLPNPPIGSQILVKRNGEAIWLTVTAFSSGQGKCLASIPVQPLAWGNAINDVVAVNYGDIIGRSDATVVKTNNHTTLPKPPSGIDNNKTAFSGW
jgi:hypothetical protein